MSPSTKHQQDTCCRLSTRWEQTEKLAQNSTERHSLNFPLSQTGSVFCRTQVPAVTLTGKYPLQRSLPVHFSVLLQPSKLRITLDRLSPCKTRPKQNHCIYQEHYHVLKYDLRQDVRLCLKSAVVILDGDVIFFMSILSNMLWLYILKTINHKIRILHERN